MRRVALVIMLAGVLGAGAFAATTRRSAQTPPRDLRIEPKGTAIVSGIVATDEPTPRPVRRATVRITGAPLMTARQTFTRDDGSFEFPGLPAGQYSLSATKPNFMTAEYGARRPGGTGSTIVLAADQRLTNIRFRLSRYGAITGVIYDQNGDPAQDISVEALRYTMRTGRRTLSSVYGRPAFTDDRGVYRLSGLSPGQYYVAAGPSPDRGPLDVQVLTTADVDRALQSLASGSTSPIVTPFTRPHQGFAPVFFPASAELARAQAIVLGLGEERPDVNIRLELVPTARVDGTVVRPDGRPSTNAQVVATAYTEAYSLDLFTGSLGTAPIDAQGHFTFPAVPPGHYVITARTPAIAGGSATAADASSGPFWASTDITVSGSDQSVSLTLQPGMSVSGKVVFNGTTIAAPANLTGIRLTMPSAQPDAITIGVPPVTVSAAGTFSLTGAAPGRYTLTSSTPPSPAGWALRSAMVNGVDALDLPFTVEPGQNIDNVVITYTDRPTELSGTLQAPTGTPTADYFIVVFAADRTYWTPNSRRSVMARPASTGKYQIRNLPPGEYFVVAVTDVEYGDWWDAEFLARLAASGTTRLTLTDGDKRTLDLRLGGGDL